uniref:Uncharacterized protein n=1 Tax=Arundo donax TaxID=35708 RepID=A0A0A8YH37_ARUDO
MPTVHSTESEYFFVRNSISAIQLFLCKCSLPFLIYDI